MDAESRLRGYAGAAWLAVLLTAGMVLAWSWLFAFPLGVLGSAKMCYFG
jgi:hypothetical protein